MIYRLKFTNPWGEVHWFCNLGGNWPASNKRLIEITCTRPEDAREFDTPEAAKEVIVAAGKPGGWQVVDESGKVVK